MGLHRSTRHTGLMQKHQIHHRTAWKVPSDCFSLNKTRFAPWTS